tara:strand:+ start:462 stop:773 length:312 start_codon:yes stop_codon:yes gene_type:complete
MGDQFRSLMYALERYISGASPDKSFLSLDEETQQMFLGLHGVIEEVDRRYVNHKWKEFGELEEKLKRRGLNNVEVAERTKKILPDHMAEKVSVVAEFVSTLEE